MPTASVVGSVGAVPRTAGAGGAQRPREEAGFFFFFFYGMVLKVTEEKYPALVDGFQV